MILKLPDFSPMYNISLVFSKLRSGPVEHLGSRTMTGFTRKSGLSLTDDERKSQLIYSFQLSLFFTTIKDNLFSNKLIQKIQNGFLRNSSVIYYLPFTYRPSKVNNFCDNFRGFYLEIILLISAEPLTPVNHHILRIKINDYGKA